MTVIRLPELSAAVQRASVKCMRPTLYTLSAIACMFVLAAPALATSRTGLPKLLGMSGRTDTLLVRPASIIYTGDGSGILGGFDGSGHGGQFGHLHWSSWTTSQALGSGAVWLDDCTPDCAGGTFHAVPAKLRAFRPSGPIFTRLTITYTYKGKRYIDRRTLARRGSFWAYGISSP